MEHAFYLNTRSKRPGNFILDFFSELLKTKHSISSRAEQNKFLLRQIATEHSKNNTLNESIVYAKRIQEAMMLKEKHLSRLFPESFMMFKPKDIVSGDFYWFTKINNRIIIAVADCTGHGIPGAFMSVLGISLLNQLIIEEQQTNPSLILQRLNHKLKKAFANSLDLRDDDKYHDGMDIALCCIDPDNRTIKFSGAFRPMYLLKNGALKEAKGSRYPIGGMYLENERSYSASTFNYSPGDRLYLCSDGFADQFGGSENKKFMTKRFKETLEKTGKYSISTQQRELERIFNEWKSNTEQTDDILILGIQLT